MLLKIHPENPGERHLKIITDCLHDGGVIIYPTDTLYGLGADATNEASVAAVRAIKGSADEKAFLCMVSDIDTAGEFVQCKSDLQDEQARALSAAFLPGPLSIILNMCGDALAPSVAPRRTNIGIRMPDHPFCISLANALGKPITSTSANITGTTPGKTFEEVLANLSEHHDRIALAIDAGPVTNSTPSTVVDLSGDMPTIIREGAIPAVDILRKMDVRTQQ